MVVAKTFFHDFHERLHAGLQQREEWVLISASLSCFREVLVEPSVSTWCFATLM